jgi:hypothetical protein
LENLPVTRIGADIFSHKWIYELILPAQLKYIGRNAFSGNSLSSVRIPDSVIAIEDLAFQNNYSLSKVILGKDLKTIGSYVFMNNNLESIIIPPGVTDIAEGAFYGNNLTMIEIGTDVTIGNRGKSFHSFYNAKGKQAGIYRYMPKNGNYSFLLPKFRARLRTTPRRRRWPSKLGQNTEARFMQ